MTRTEFFDRLALQGELFLLGEDEKRKLERLRRRLGDLSGQRVLEPGCGAGALTEFLAQWVGTSGRVLAFDASSAMVAACRKRTHGLPHVCVRVGEIGHIQIGRGCWDLIILFRVFPHIDNRPYALRWLRECLAPRGRLVIANLEGSAELNRFHQQIDGPVQNDFMPSAIELKKQLEQLGYEVTCAIDSSDEFYLEARLAPTALP